MKKKATKLIPNNYSSEWDEGIFLSISLIVILIPVLFYPRSITIFDPIKNTAFQLLALIGISLWMLKRINAEKITLDYHPLNISIYLFLIYGSLSLTWSINIYRSLLFLPLFLAGPIVFILSSSSIFSQKKMNLILFIIIFTGAGMGIYGILQYLGIDSEIWTGNVGRQQVFGLFGNVNYFAEYLILPLALAIGLFLFGHKSVVIRVLLFFSIVFLSSALFFTLTRSSYLGITVAVIMMIFLYFFSNKHQFQSKKYLRNIVIISLVIITTTLAIIYLPSPLNDKETILGRLKSRATIENILSGSSTMRRIATWKFTWMMIQDRPLVGSGINTFGYHTLEYQSKFFAQGNNRDIYPHGFAVQAHNEYLQIWSELGIIGLLLFLSIILIYFRGVLLYLKRIEAKEKAVVIGLAGGITAVLIDSLFGFPLQLAGSTSLLWLFMGLTFSQIIIFGKWRNEQKEAAKINKYQSELPAVDSKTKKNILFKIALSFLVILVMIGSMSLIVRPFIGRVYWYYGNRQLDRGGNYNETIAIYEKGLNWNPWQGEMYFDLANLLLNRGLNNLALEYFLNGQKYADHPNLPQNIGALYLKTGDYEKAIHYLEKGILYQQSKNKMLPLQIQLGNLYLSHQDYQNASRHFGSAIDNNPDSAEAYYGIAGVYVNTGEKEKTIEALEKVIELAPESKLAGYAKTMLIKIELDSIKDTSIFIE